MKRIKTIISLILAVALSASCAVFVAGCDAKGKDGADFTVYTSFYPIYDFTVKIAGGRANVVNLVPAGTEPHDYELSTTDIRAVSDADLLIVNGLGLETWIDDVSSSSGTKVVYASKDVETLFVDGVTDPHIWLSPERAKKMMKNIADALSAADPADADLFQANYSRYAVLLDALDLKFRAVLSSCQRHEIVVAHAAFGYLCADFGLTQIPIEGLSADSEPDAAKMAQIIDYVVNHGITTIFYEELISPAVARSFASQTGAVAAVLNPLEGLSDEDYASGSDYFTVMAENLIALEAALGGTL